MAIDKAKLLKAAEKFIATGKIPQAIDEYLKILKENPKDWNLMIQIGDLYLKANKPPDAIQYFQKVADHYYSDGFFLKAIAIYKRINKLDPNLTDICTKLADLYLKQGLTMDAKSQLQMVAQHYLSKNQTKDAILTLKKLIEIEPDNLKSRNDLAKAYKNEGMIAEAVKEYTEISDELSRKSMLKESLAVLETAFKLDPVNATILRKILAIYAEQKDANRATTLLEEALKTDPGNSQVLALLAETLANKGQYSKAQETIDRAVNNTSDKDPFLTIKGDLFLQEGNLQKAFAQYEQVIDRLVKRREPEKAIAVLEKITHADPSYLPAFEKLVDLYASTKQETLLISTYNLLIDTCIDKGKHHEAEQYLEKLMKLEPENGQHAEKLQFVRTMLGKPKTVTPAPPPPHVKEEINVSPEVSDEVSSEDFDLSINLDMDQHIEEQAPPPPPPAPVIAHPPKAKEPAPLPPASEKPAPPLRTPPPPPPPPSAVAPTPENTEEEKEFVSEHLIEAEVFTKYGLIDKAIEQLHMITVKYPNSVLAHQKLKEIFLEKGERDKAVEECVSMSHIFRKQGDLDQAEDLLSEARQINPNHPSLDRAYREIPAPVAAPEPVAPPPPVPARAPQPPPAARPAPAQRASAGSSPDVLGEIEKLAQSMKHKPASKQPAAKAPIPPAPAPPPPPPPPSIDEIEIEVDLPIEEELPETGTTAGGLGSEKFEEMDFYASQGLMSEARKLLDVLKESHPDDPGVVSRMEKYGEPAVSEAEQSPVEASFEQSPALDLLESGAPETYEPEAPQIVMEEHSSVVEETVNETIEPEPAAEEPEVQETSFEVSEIAVPGFEESIELDVPAEDVAEAIPSLDDRSVEDSQPDEFSASVEEALAQAAAEIPQELPREEEEPESLAEEESIVMEDASEPDQNQAENFEAIHSQEVDYGVVSSPDILPPLEQTMDLGDLAELAGSLDVLNSDNPDGLMSLEDQDQVTEELPVVDPAASVEEPAMEPAVAQPLEEITDDVEPEEFESVEDFGELEVEPGQSTSTGDEDSEADLSFPADQSLDDALNAAFTDDEEEAVKETTPVQASQELFEEEDDFFDLAAELEDGFLNVQNAVEEERPADGQNYSIEEILTDFKKGVEKQLGAEDYDTRYNLGIAYKEMGLIDEAIAEFQIASKDEKRFLECCSMLGLCFLEKGMPKLALKWYQRGLDTKGHGEEEYLGLRFDMAQAYEQTGELDKALESYQEVYGANAGYRNVVKKLKDVQDQMKS